MRFSAQAAGQTCIGTERVYVHEKVFDAFINEITSQAKDLHAGPDGKIGPITMPSQLDIIKSHIDDAIAGGAAKWGLRRGPLMRRPREPAGSVRTIGQGPSVPQVV